MHHCLATKLEEESRKRGITVQPPLQTIRAPIVEESMSDERLTEKIKELQQNEYIMLSEMEKMEEELKSLN
jgi:hypothetical protein